MSQKTVNVGTVPNDGTGDQPRTAFQSINSNFTELYGAAQTAVLGTVFVDAYGAKGDGSTDDTAAIQAAENARTTGQVLKFTPGKTYVVSSAFTGSGNASTTLLQMVSAGTWDCSNATLKFGAAGNMTTGTDGGGYGVVNVLAAPALILGIIDCNSKARFGVTVKSQLANVRYQLTILNVNEGSGTVWCGMSYATSADLTGTAISGRAGNVSGILDRPSCAIIDTTDTITGHGDVTAFVLGGRAAQTLDNYTGAALVFGGGGVDSFLPYSLGRAGIRSSGKPGEGNVALGDLITHDLGHNTRECLGDTTITSSGAAYGYAMGVTIGDLIKAGSHSGWFHYNVQSASTTPPNVDVTGGAGVQGATGYIAGQWSLGNQKPSATASYSPDLSKGNDFVVPASGATLTIGAPANVPTNPSGLTLAQLFSVTIQRLSGGALTTTWDVAYHLAGAWTDPSGANTQRSIWFRYDIGAAVAYEISRSAADVTV